MLYNWLFYVAAGAAMGELASPDRFEDTEHRQRLVKLTRQAKIDDIYLKIPIISRKYQSRTQQNDRIQRKYQRILEAALSPVDATKSVFDTVQQELHKDPRNETKSLLYIYILTHSWVPMNEPLIASAKPLSEHDPCFHSI